MSTQAGRYLPKLLRPGERMHIQAAGPVIPRGMHFIEQKIWRQKRRLQGTNACSQDLRHAPPLLRQLLAQTKIEGQHKPELAVLG